VAGEGPTHPFETSRDLSMRWSLYQTVVDQNPPTGVDRQYESREARSLYPSAMQLARYLMLRFVGHATWPIPGQEGVWCASASFLYTETRVNISPSRNRLFRWLLHRLWGANGNPGIRLDLNTWAEVLRSGSGKILLYYHQASLIYDDESSHHITETFYAWLGLTSMRNNMTLTRKEA
jgi:hypothetical protein